MAQEAILEDVVMVRAQVGGRKSLEDYRVHTVSATRIGWTQRTTRKATYIQRTSIRRHFVVPDAQACPSVCLPVFKPSVALSSFSPSLVRRRLGTVFL